MGLKKATDGRTALKFWQGKYVIRYPYDLFNNRMSCLTGCVRPLPYASQPGR